MQDHARSQRSRRKQQGIKLETPQRAEYLSLAAVAKCLQAVTWLVARGNKIMHKARFRSSCPPQMPAHCQGSYG